MSKDERKTAERREIPNSARWIRPALTHDVFATPTTKDRPNARALDANSVDEWSHSLLLESRERLSHLTVLERQLEERIRLRSETFEEEQRQHSSALEAELCERRAQADADSRRLANQAEEEGRAAGYREGFSQGREAGVRLGLEEGRRDGRQQGRREGQENIANERRQELTHAAEALGQAVDLLRDDRDAILQTARSHFLALAIEVAKKILKREIAHFPDSVLRNVEKAVELLFRRGTLDIQVHPEDAPHVEAALRCEPRWTEGFEDIAVTPSEAVTRGGCRVVSSAGVVDMTIETQLALIADALDESLRRPEPDGAAATARAALEPLEGKR